MKNFLVTGSAGFIGFHTCLKILSENKNVIGIDNFDNYYDTKLKIKRNNILKKNKNFSFIKADINNKKKIKKIFDNNNIDVVIHLAAQAGVRYSVLFPEKYISVNIMGFFNIIDNCQKKKIKHFLYASTSSVYGNNTNYPLKESYSASHPTHIYAATKRSNELIAHSYSSLHNLPTTGLRFFTAYGPWGRPDMALFKFASNIISKKKIDIYNYGNHQRDFTYIDDVVECINRAIYKIPKKNIHFNQKHPDPKISDCPYQIINIGGNNPLRLNKFVKLIEEFLRIKSKKRFLPLQKADIIKTQASISWCKKVLDYVPKIDAKKGTKLFLIWYRNYYK